ncbi:MAG: DUF3459 domain-containing protein [Anaerolineales bacterium]|nr:DUF3459 domain-containing protein [Anaerolineales bacterium]
MLAQNFNHHRPWWQTAVIYQIYPRSFKDTSGNGIGDLRGIIEKLDYLSETLGVDAIWLSPFYPSPMVDFGYDVADYCDVHPMFGSLADFDVLLAEAHRRDLRVIIDWVPNHSSDQHPWFQQSRASLDNPKRNWYVWRAARPDGSPPNNWLAVFGGSAWEFDSLTGQYYLHSFTKEQPDLNWRNPEVRAAMFDVIRFWLERGVDGFRVDVAHFVMKDPQLRNNPPSAPGETEFHRSHGDYDSLIHLYDKGHPDAHAVYRDFRAILDQYSAPNERLSVGEIHIFDWAEWTSYYGNPKDGLEFHMPFNFSLLNTPWTAQAVRQKVDGLEANLPEWAWPNYVLGNHDEGRLASRYGIEQARVAGLLLLTLRGTPTLYYGDEIGMTDVEIPPAQQMDPYGKHVPEHGRDRCRTPMQWDPGPLAGFSPPGTPTTWLPLAPDYEQVNVASQLHRPGSMLSFYRGLFALRRNWPALQVGDYQPLEGLPAQCFGYRRWFEDQQLLVILNFSTRQQFLQLPQFGPVELVFSTHLARQIPETQRMVELNNFALHPNEGIVLKC